MGSYELIKREVCFLKNDFEIQVKFCVREIINEKMKAIIMANKKLCDAYQKKRMYKQNLEDEYKKSDKLIELAYGKKMITAASYESYKEGEASLQKRISALQVCFWELVDSSTNSQTYLKMLEIIKEDMSKYNKAKNLIEFYKRHYLTRISYAEKYILNLFKCEMASPQFLTDEIVVYIADKKGKELGHVAREKMFSLIKYFMYINRQRNLMNQMFKENKVCR